MLKRTNYPQYTLKETCSYHTNACLNVYSPAVDTIRQQVCKESFSAAKIIIDKTENLITENQSHTKIVCIFCKGRIWVSTALLFF